jgi:hypothetical protein
MRGREIYSTLEKLRTDEHRFVKWWRKENDFLDYDLIERFIKNAETSEEIDGFDLLTLDEMWDELKRVGGSRVNLRHDPKGDSLEWVHEGKEGTHTEVCAFTPESVMHIFDVETRGNPIV